MTKLFIRAAVIAVIVSSAFPAYADPLMFGGRTWYTNDPDPGSDPSYSAAGNTGVMVGQYGQDAVIATPVTIAVGDTVSYDYTLTNPPTNNWVGDSFGDFRGGTLVDDTNSPGYLISGQVGYLSDFYD